MKQEEAFSIILDAIETISERKTKPIRIAINGIEGTGKTTFATNLVMYVNAKHFPAFHVSIDGFHFNKRIRYRQGRNSAKGYYEDAYDEATFVEMVLQRSQKSQSEYIEATHDLKTDTYLNLRPKVIPSNAVLVTDGCYLFKPVFNEHWDLRVYLKTDFDTALKRGAERDKHDLGGYEEAKQKFTSRYHLASKRYISEVRPIELADLVFDITDFNSLELISKS